MRNELYQRELMAAAHSTASRAQEIVQIKHQAPQQQLYRPKGDGQTLKY